MIYYVLLVTLLVIIIYYIGRFCKYHFPVITSLTPGYYEKTYATMHNKPFYITNKYNYDPADTNIISVSIYGKHPKYFDGLQRRIDEVNTGYHGWTLRVYCHEEVPQHYMNNLITNTSIQTFIVNDPEIVPGNSAGAFWRFMPITEPGINFIVVDVDEPINIKSDMVKSWMASDADAIRVYHNQMLVLGYSYTCASLVGIKASIKISAKMLQYYPMRAPFGSDEIWLTKHIYPLIRNKEILFYKSPVGKILHNFTRRHNVLS